TSNAQLRRCKPLQNTHILPYVCFAFSSARAPENRDFAELNLLLNVSRIFEAACNKNGLNNAITLPNPTCRLLITDDVKSHL
ncbi:MAG: hypothetical protein OEM06_09610, partial [Desulfobacteraceae bacterium]|nr:hypothetical protein [Desulfobacteraceae bacterium]